MIRQDSCENRPLELVSLPVPPSRAAQVRSHSGFGVPDAAAESGTNGAKVAVSAPAFTVPAVISRRWARSGCPRQPGLKLYARHSLRAQAYWIRATLFDGVAQ